MENETTDETFDADVEADPSDFGPYAVAAVALAGSAIIGGVVAKNYGRVRDGVRNRIAARRERSEELTELEAIETTAVEVN